MFGFSMTKLLLLAGTVFAVWYGFKFLSRLQDQRSERPLERTRKAEPERREADGEAETMVQCPVCDAYVPEGGARHCGRDACPY